MSQQRSVHTTAVVVPKQQGAAIAARSLSGTLARMADGAAAVIDVSGWSGRNTFDVPAVYLRDSDPSAFHAQTKQRNSFLGFAHPKSLVVSDIAIGGDAVVGETLRVTWGDGHTAEHPIHDLWTCFGNDEEEVHGSSGSSCCDPDSAPVISWSSKSLDLRKFEFDRIMASDAELLRWLEAITITGLCVVEGCPVQPNEALARISDRVGFMRATHYDEDGLSIFNVISKDDPNNQAYTDGMLPLHTDLPFMQSPPDFQLLACLEQARAGGNSTFADGLFVANYLKHHMPELYAALAAHPVDFCDDEQQWKYRAAQLTITQDEARTATGAVDAQSPAGSVKICFNEGVRAREWTRPQKICGADAAKVLDALRAFAQVAESPKARVEYRMRPGDMVCFDNRRILHGRTAFDRRQPAGNDQKPARRHLQGTYLNHDEVAARIRFLRVSRGKAGDRARL